MKYGRNHDEVTHDDIIRRFKKDSHSHDLIISEDVNLPKRIPCQKTLFKITYNTGGNKCDKIVATAKKTKSIDKSKIDDISNEGFPILGFPAALSYSTNKSANFYNVINYEADGDEDVIGYEKYPYLTLPITQYAEDIILTTTENKHDTYLVVIKDHQSVIRSVANKKKNTGCPNPVAHNKFILPLVFMAQNQLCYAIYTLKKNSMVYISNRLYFFTINIDKCVETRQKIIWSTTLTTPITCCTCSNLFIDERRCIYCNFIIFKNMSEHLKIHKICLFCNKETIPLNEHYNVYHSKKNKFIDEYDSRTFINFKKSKTPSLKSSSSSSSSESESEGEDDEMSKKYDMIENETLKATDFLENMNQDPEVQEVQKPESKVDAADKNSDMEKSDSEKFDSDDEKSEVEKTSPQTSSKPTPSPSPAPSPSPMDEKQHRPQEVEVCDISDSDSKSSKETDDSIPTPEQLINQMRKKKFANLINCVKKPKSHEKKNKKPNFQMKKKSKSSFEVSPTFTKNKSSKFKIGESSPQIVDVPSPPKGFEYGGNVVTSPKTAAPTKPAFHTPKDSPKPVEEPRFHTPKPVKKTKSQAEEETGEQSPEKKSKSNVGKGIASKPVCIIL